jgi:hypothetical protein
VGDHGGAYPVYERGAGVDKWILKAGLVSDEELMRWVADARQRRITADMTAIEYEHRKPRIENGIRKKLVKRHGVVDDWRFRQEMGENWAINDLIKKHAWHRDEAASLNLAIQTQLALRAAIETIENRGRVSA